MFLSLWIRQRTNEVDLNYHWLIRQRPCSVFWNSPIENSTKSSIYQSIRPCYQSKIHKISIFRDLNIIVPIFPIIIWHFCAYSWVLFTTNPISDHNWIFLRVFPNDIFDIIQTIYWFVLKFDLVILAHVCRIQLTSRHYYCLCTPLCPMSVESN